MKFSRQFSKTRREVTPRRLANAARKLQQEADAFALFPELQPKETPAQRVASIDEDVERYFQILRDHSAATWRRARRTLRTLPPNKRAKILHRWETGGQPKTACYLADLIHTTLHPFSL